MKKGFLIVLIICIICCVIYNYSIFHVHRFSLNDIVVDIQSYEERRKEEKPLILGKIENRKDVVIKADSVLFDVYGEDLIKSEKPYKVSYDKINDVWLVQGRVKFQFFFKGGVAYILIRGSDGSVIAFWHEE